jgi:predicted transcriptional regulator
MTAKSKLEHYEDVLQILSNKQLTLDAIAFQGNMDCRLLREKMDFLLENMLVEMLECKRKTVYALTNRGEAVLKTLTLTKRLEKLQAQVINAAIEAQPVHTVQSEAWKARGKR